MAKNKVPPFFRTRCRSVASIIFDTSNNLLVTLDAAAMMSNTSSDHQSSINHHATGPNGTFKLPVNGNYYQYTVLSFTVWESLSNRYSAVRYNCLMSAHASLTGLQHSALYQFGRFAHLSTDYLC